MQKQQTIFYLKFSTPRLSSFEVLEVDCFSSLKNQFSFELYDFVAKDDLTEESDEPYFETHFYNKYIEEDIRHVRLNNTSVSFLKIVMEKTLAEIVGRRQSSSSNESTTNRISTSASVDFGNVFSGNVGFNYSSSLAWVLGRERDGNVEGEMRDGHTTIEKKKTTYRINENMRIKGCHKIIIITRQKMLILSEDSPLTTE